jgi:four helix bundle protein
MQKPNTKNTNQKQKNEFSKRIYLYTLSSLKYIGTINTKGDAIARVIIEQLIRSLTSIAANIVEARACNSKKDFARYFDIALKSANETKLWLCLLRDLQKTDKQRVEEILKETVEIAKILGSSLITMRNKSKSF